MRGLGLTAAAAVMGVLTAPAIAEESTELTASDRAEQFVNTVSVMTGAVLPANDILEMALESHFSGASACDIADGFAVSTTLVQRRIADVNSLLAEAEEAVVAAGFPDFRQLQDEMYELVIEEDGYFPSDIERAKREVIRNNPDFADYEIQEMLYRSAINEWLSDNHDLTTEALYEELRSLDSVLAVTSSTERGGSTAVRVATLGCDVENDNPTTNAGPAVFQSIIGSMSPS